MDNIISHFRLILCGELDLGLLFRIALRSIHPLSLAKSSHSFNRNILTIKISLYLKSKFMIDMIW